MAASREPARPPAPARPVLRVIGPDEIIPVEAQPLWRRALDDAAQRPLRVLAWGVVSLVLLLGWSTYMATRHAEHSLMGFRAELEEVRHSLTGVDSEAARVALARARNQLHEARSSRSAVGVRLLSSVPGLER